jgi:hypothetical protein
MSGITSQTITGNYAVVELPGRKMMNIKRSKILSQVKEGMCFWMLFHPFLE